MQQKSQYLRQLISKEQQKNIYLTEVHNSFKAKIQKNEVKDIAQEEFRQDIKQAQLKNIAKRIEIYEQELEKLNKLNVKGLVVELKAKKKEIQEKQKQRNNLLRQVGILEEQNKRLIVKNYGQNRNKQIQSSFVQKNAEMEILQRRLDILEVTQVPRKQWMKKGKSVSKVQVVENTKSKIDSFALYKNLLRFYMKEEEKLKQQMVVLEEESTKRKQLIKSIQEQIQQYRKKIESVRQIKSLASIK